MTARARFWRLKEIGVLKAAMQAARELNLPPEDHELLRIELREQIGVVMSDVKHEQEGPR